MSQSAPQLSPEMKAIHDEMSDQFRLGIQRAFLEADKITIYRELPTSIQMSAFMGGTMTGVATVLLGMAKPSTRDEVWHHIVSSLPMIREQAERLIEQMGINS